MLAICVSMVASIRLARNSKPSLVVYYWGVISESLADLLLSTKRSNNSLVLGADDSYTEPI